MKSLVAALVLVPAAAWGAPPADGQTFGTPCIYPETALAAHSEGTTLLSYRGTDDGRVDDVQILQSSGHVDLDDAAVRCVSQWRFNPQVDKFNIGTREWNIAWTIAANGTGDGKSLDVPHDCRAYYPEEESRAGIEGTTTVNFVITREGRVVHPRLEKPSGNSHLDDAALQCVKTWRYRPATENGKPVSVNWKADVVWKSVAATVPAFSEPPLDCLKSYPVTASDLVGIAGVTELEFVIAQGNVSKVSVVTSSGNTAMDEAAKACVATRHYVREMVRLDGKVVDRYRTITLREKFVWANALKAAK